MTAGLVVHNVPLAFADHLGPLLKDCFGDSKTTQDYRYARTKSSCIIYEELASYFTQELVKELKNGPYLLRMGQMTQVYPKLFISSAKHLLCVNIEQHVHLYNSNSSL